MTLPAKTIARRRLLRWAASGAAAALLPRGARAQAYPTHPVRLIAGFPAGGQIDIIARLTAQYLGQVLKQNVVVENKPGAGGNLGAEAVVKAPPDGYTLFFAASSNTVNTTLFAHLPYDFARDTTAVGPINRIPLVLVANPSFEPKTVSELIATAKQKPGALTMGSPSAGTPPYLAVALLKMMAGIDLVQVPYFGESQMITDLLGGQLMIGIGGISSAIGHIKAGRLRALGLTTPDRIEQLPDVPAIGETVPGFAASGWSGIVAPKNTPAPIVDTLARAIRTIEADPEFKARLADLGAPLFAMPPAEFSAFIVSETEKWAKVIKFAGLKPQ
jgi:tripartite-type tricarboxylate transporter receptor subunit TctC